MHTTIRDTLARESISTVSAAGTSEGARKGWETRKHGAPQKGEVLERRRSDRRAAGAIEKIGELRRLQQELREEIENSPGLEDDDPVMKEFRKVSQQLKLQRNLRSLQKAGGPLARMMGPGGQERRGRERRAAVSGKKPVRHGWGGRRAITDADFDKPDKRKLGGDLFGPGSKSSHGFK